MYVHAVNFFHMVRVKQLKDMAQNIIYSMDGRSCPQKGPHKVLLSYIT